MGIATTRVSFRIQPTQPQRPTVSFNSWLWSLLSAATFWWARCCSVCKSCLTATPGTAVCQASLSFTISLSLLKFMSIESVMPSNYLILCHPLHLLLSIFPSIRVSSSESALCIRWPKYWSFNFSISPSNEYSGLILCRIDWFDLLTAKGFSRVFSSITVQKHQFVGAQPSLQSNS